MKVLILEDDLLEADRIVKAVKDFFDKNCEILGPFTDFSAAVESIKFGLPDFAILDIQLGANKYAGINLAEVLQKIYYVPVIFLTGISERSLLEKVDKIPYCDFLKKPFNKESINRSFEKAKVSITHRIYTRHRTSILPNSSDRFWAKVGRSDFKAVSYDDIAFIRSIGHYNEVFCKSLKHPLIIKGNLRSDIFLAHFSSYANFYLLGRSHIINKTYLDYVKGNRLVMSIDKDDGCTIDIPRNSKVALFNWLGLNPK